MNNFLPWFIIKHLLVSLVFYDVTSPFISYKWFFHSFHSLLKKLDSTKVQTLGEISESILNEIRHCTAASYTIRWDTGPRGVYLSTEPVSCRLAASAGKPGLHIRFSPLRWAASGKGKVKEASGGRARRVGSGWETNRGRGSGKAHGTYTQAHTATAN